MIYFHASYLSALNFVSISIDNVDLVEFVCDDKKKEDLALRRPTKSIMLQQEIIVACNEADGEKDKSKIPAMFVKNQIRNIKTRLCTSYSFWVLFLCSQLNRQIV